MGNEHLQSARKCPKVNIYAVCDTDKALTEKLASKYNAKAYSDAKALIEDKNIDIVIIATYPSSHLELLELCLKNAKHVLCEKPISNTAEDAQKFRQLMEQYRSLKVAVGYILRHNSTFIKLKEMADSLGKPLVMRWTHNQNSASRQKALTNLLGEVSPIVDCGVHYIDLMRWLTGEEVTEIDSFGARINKALPKDSYNYGMINLNFSGGSVGFYETGWAKSFDNTNTKELIGPNGRIKLTYKSQRGIFGFLGNLITYYDAKTAKTTKYNIPFKSKPTKRQLEYLIEMIEHNAPANPSVEDIIASFEIACEADKIIIENLKKKVNL